MRFHAHRVDDRVGTESAGEVADGITHIIDLVHVHRLDAACLRACESFRDSVDADDPCALMGGDASGHVADRAESEHGNRSPAGYLGVLDGLPCGRENVRQVHVARIRVLQRHLDVGELRLRHTEILCLATGHRSVQLRIAEQCGTRSLFGDTGRLTLRHEPSLQKRHEPQEIWKGGMTTRSPPTLRSPVSEPTSSTMPIGSWPRMSPAFMNGPRTS